MDLLTRVRRTIGEHALASRDTRVVVALSGGSDSVALACILSELDAAGELRLVGLAHFNHQLRANADLDERFCHEVARRLERPLVTDREDVAGRARRERRSIEDAGHASRLAFLERARLHVGADVVAVGHSRDDQAETFLLRLLRGAGVRGLAGIHPRHDTIVRPVLDCRRSELRAYLDAREIAYLVDESNDDVGIPRNRIRAELLPLLERRFNPSIVDVLADEAELAREEWRCLAAAADELASRICRHGGDSWCIDANALNGAPPAIARMVMSGAMKKAAGGRAVSFAHVEAALRLSRRSGPAIDGPRQRVERRGADVVLTGRPAGALGRPGRETPEVSLFQYPLSIPGEVELVEAGCIVSAEAAPRAENPGGRAVPRNRLEAQVRLDRCQGSLSVRNRRPGDRFRPAGLSGRKKLQDYFVDRKIARQRRDSIPLVVDGSDRIVWVAGHSIDDEFRVTDPAQAVLILRLKVPGGPA